METNTENQQSKSLDIYLIQEQELNTIPKLYETEDQNLEQKKAWIHLLGINGWEWFIAEMEKSPDSEDDTDITCFGYVRGYTSEWGYFNLSEFIALNKQRQRQLQGPAVIRDKFFQPVLMSQIINKSSDTSEN